MQEETIYPKSFASKLSRSTLVTIVTTLLTVLGFIATQVFTFVNKKLDLIDNNREAIVALQGRDRSEQAQWEKIQEQQKMIAGMVIKIEVLQQLVLQADSNKTFTINIIKQDESPTISKVNSPKLPVDDFKRVLQEVDNLNREDINTFKQRAIENVK